MGRESRTKRTKDPGKASPHCASGSPQPQRCSAPFGLGCRGDGAKGAHVPLVPSKASQHDHGASIHPQHELSSPRRDLPRCQPVFVCRMGKGLPRL